VGEAGQFLRKKLKTLGINLERDCRKINAINCRPPNNRTPTNQEITDCRPRIWEEIQRFSPKAILLLGKSALKSFLDFRRTRSVESVAPWRGWTIPDRDAHCWVSATYHPSFVLREEKSSAADAIFTQDLKTFSSLYETPFPESLDIPQKVKEETYVDVFTRKEQTHNYLKRLIKDPPEIMAFDYETTGLKPDAPGHDIISCSICTHVSDAKSFLVQDNKTRRLLGKILQDPRTKKIAANWKFEERWTQKILGVPVSNWYWDTMVMAHVLDNRTGITGLKFQAYVRFGIVDYDSHLRPFLEGKRSDGANATNRIREAPVHDLLLYGGLDSLLEFRLALIQQKEVKEWGLEQACDLFHNGLRAFSHMETQGICVDVDYCKKQDKRLKKQSKKIEDKLMKKKEIKWWQNHVPKGRKFNLYSDDQLSALLYSHLKLNAEVQTDKGKDSASEEALEKLKKDVPFVKDLLMLRKIRKARNTYLGNLLKETVDGVMRPFFNIHNVVTYRSSSSNINFQNVPKRNEYFKKTIRKSIFPPQDYLLLEADFSGLEVCIGACYHKDPNMIAEVTDPNRDMHRDMAKECFLLNNDEWTKPIRGEAKGDFVFAEFYGSYYAQCAKKLWEQIKVQNLKTKQGVGLYAHLKNKGIKRYEEFEAYIKKVEERFWGERFSVYAEWKVQQWRRYQEKGHVDLKTGFRCGGLMNERETSNYPIQGSAFHCLLWSLIEIDKELRIRKYRSCVIFQIHDSVGLIVHPDEYNAVLGLIKEVTEVRLREMWDWIIVPLQIEIEVAPMNEPWYNLREVSSGKCSVCSAEWLYSEQGVYECPLCGDKSDLPF